MYIPEIRGAYIANLVSTCFEVLDSCCPRHFPAAESVGMKPSNQSGDIVVAVNKAFCRDLSGFWGIFTYTVMPHTTYRIPAAGRRRLGRGDCADAGRAGDPGGAGGRGPAGLPAVAGREADAAGAAAQSAGAMPQQLHAGFLDVEGQGDHDEQYDMFLATPALLVSKVVIFHSGDPCQGIESVLHERGMIALCKPKRMQEHANSIHVALRSHAALLSARGVHGDLAIARPRFVDQL